MKAGNIMWIILIIIIIVLLLICTNLFIQKTKLQQEIDFFKPVVEATENIRDIIYYCETVPKLKYRYLSPSVNNVIGPNAREEHLENPDLIYDIVHPDDRETLKRKQFGQLDFHEPIKVRYQNHLGEYLWFEEYATPIFKNGKVIAVQGVFRNIHEKVVLQQQLEYKSTHDALTNLNNRYYFHLMMDDYNERNIPIAIIVGDLDELKTINDKYGHQMGDRLISEAAKCLKAFADKEITLARIGGDEFALLFPNRTVSQVEEYIINVQEKMQQDYEDLPFAPIQMSFGYEYSNSSYGIMDQLLNKADANMYQNKREKKNSLEVR